MPVSRHRDADRLQEALERAGAPGSGAGGEGPTGELASLVALTREVTALRERVPGPDPDFVARLREQLREEAASRPVTAHPEPGTRRSGDPAGPRTIALGRLPKLVLAAAAAVIVVAGMVGVAARTSLPGGLLYPVKSWMDAVALDLAGSQYDRGLAHLEQAQNHITDARRLADDQPVESEPMVVALDSATESVVAGGNDLFTVYRNTGNEAALQALRDFAAQARPQVDALRPDVPAAARPAHARLVAVLDQLDGAIAGVPVTCLGCPSAQVSPTSAAPSAATATMAPSSVAPGADAPGTAGPSESPLPGVASSAEVSVGGGGVGVDVSPLPTLSIPLLTTTSAPLPSVGGGVSSTSASVGVSVPGVGGVTIAPTLP